MWTRGELKRRGMAAFKANYWRCVLIAFILSVISGGISGGGGSRVNINKNDIDSIIEQFKGRDDQDYEYDYDQDYDDDYDPDYDYEYDPDYDSDYDSDYDYDYDDDYDYYDEDYDSDDWTLRSFLRDLKEDTGSALGLLFVLAVVIFFIIFILVISFLFSAFLLNPIRVGCDRFFVRNLNGPAELNHLSAGFDTNYKNVVKVMFFEDLYVLLWSLIPIAGIIIGIVKRYEYRMIPYLLADDPDMDKEEAFARSKEMMTGEKWNAFVLDLSFIGWHFLALFTLGILEIFYVAPYVHSTCAALYETLLGPGGSRPFGYPGYDGGYTSY